MSSAERKNPAAALPGGGGGWLGRLPPEVLDQVLLLLDAPSLCNLAETSRAMHAALSADALWTRLLRRRFRDAPPPVRPRGPRAPRDVYAQWHAQHRMPAQRVARGAVFARGRTRKDSALAWATVPSTSDCRVPPAGLPLRVVVQNVGIEDLVVCLARAYICLEGAGTVRPVFDTTPRIDRALGGPFPYASDIDTVRLRKDDCIVLSCRVPLPGVVHEVDALERITSLTIRLHPPPRLRRRRGRRHPRRIYDPLTPEDSSLTLQFRHATIWESYAHMPGDWWVRTDLGGGTSATNSYAF